MTAPATRPGPDDQPGLYDEAAQAERTTLAWSRSLLALAANGALLVRAATGAGAWAATVGGVVLALSLVLWVSVQAAYRRGRGQAMTRVLAGPRVVVAVAALVVAVGAADLAAVVLAR